MPCTFKGYCSGCPYSGALHLPSTERRLPLTMEHNPDTTALLIFQAPGPQEWTARKPICSGGSRSAAARIRNSLGCINNASRCNFSITNAVQCYPGRLDSGDGDKEPEPAAHGQCANWLRMDIETHRWRRIVVFGKNAELSVRCLGYGCDPRFRFEPHPTSRGPERPTNDEIKRALCWALERDNADG